MKRLNRLIGLSLCLLFATVEASYDFGGAGRFLTGTLNTSRSLPLTLACFSKIADHPASLDYMLTLSKDAEANEFIAIQASATNDRYDGMSAGAVGTVVASYTATPPEYDGVWLPIVLTVGGNTERDIFVELFANGVENTDSQDPSSVLVQVKVAVAPDASSRFGGLLAECAIWTGELSEANITSYLAGNCASGIDAGNLIGFYPLDTNRDGPGTILNEGTDTGGTLTITGGAVYAADHPTITCGSATATPRRRRMNQ